MSGECLEGFWEISGRVSNVSGGCLPIIFDPKIILNPNFLWPNIFATLGLHLGFSAKLRIWQVPTCKMEPRSGMIIDLLTTHPPPQPLGQKSFVMESIILGMSRGLLDGFQSGS